MTEPKNKSTRSRAAAAAAKKPEKTLAEQQLESFTGPNGKSHAVAFFKTQLPKLVMDFDHGQEAYELIKKWDGMRNSVSGKSEIDLEEIGEIIPDIRRFVEMVYGENAREVVIRHWGGNLWDLFQEVFLI